MNTITANSIQMQNLSPWKQFESQARIAMSRLFETEFLEKNPNGFPKRFDFVSDEKEIIGDAKFLSLVRGTKTPPAKLMEITGHIWLLEKCNAKIRFLVFGNQIEVIQLWLRKYGNIEIDVQLYYLSSSCVLERIR